METLPIFIGRFQNRSPRFGGGGEEPFMSLSEIEGRLHSCVSPKLANLMSELSRVLLETCIHFQHAALNYKSRYCEVDKIRKLLLPVLRC